MKVIPRLDVDIEGGPWYQKEKRKKRYNKIIAYQ